MNDETNERCMSELVDKLNEDIDEYEKATHAMVDSVTNAPFTQRLNYLLKPASLRSPMYEAKWRTLA